MYVVLGCVLEQYTDKHSVLRICLEDGSTGDTSMFLEGFYCVQVIECTVLCKAAHVLVALIYTVKHTAEW